jgi:peptidylprolyl isomerase
MNDGDFIKINFEMYVGDDKKLVSTNKEQLAKDNDIYDEKLHYREAVLIVGSEGLFNDINESFKSAEVGKEYEVTISPENAYGLRDPKNIKVHTVREFQRHEIDPVPGQEITLGNRRGRIISVTPGRVLVDYNHQWAGKSVYYKYNVIAKVDSDVEKVRALIDYNYNQDSEDFKVESKAKAYTITIPEEAKFDPVWIEAKYRLINDVRKYLPGKDIKIEEVYKGEEEKPKEEPKEETPAESAEPKKEEKKEKTAEKGNSEVEQKNTE